jgi:hypothetical protein
MKTVRFPLALLVASVAALGTGVLAQTTKGLEGTWTLDTAKSTFSPGPAPKSMTLTYSADAKDGMKIVVNVSPATGAPQHWEMTARSDGKDYPVIGNPDADMISMKVIDDHTSESTFTKAGKATATNRRVLSKDGKTLTITSTGTTADGKPRKDVQVFHKAAAKTKY